MRTCTRTCTYTASPRGRSKLLDENLKILTILVGGPGAPRWAPGIGPEAEHTEAPAFYVHFKGNCKVILRCLQ